MSLALERGVPQEERRKVILSGLTDWDAARIFLEVVRCGSFRSAAERLHLSINAVRRRIDDFERQIGATLFTRDVLGTHLTDEGAMVVSAVERMEAASFDQWRRHRRFPDLCLRARRQDRSSRGRVAPAVRYLALLPSRQRPHPSGAAHDRLAGGGFQSRQIPLVQGRVRPPK